MIRVLVSYPNTAGARFDFDYYLGTHVPLVETKLRGRGLTGWTIDKGLSGAAPGSQPEFLVQAHLLFESIEAFKAAMESEGAEIMADIPNYTDIQPQIQVNKVLAQQAS
jgi:uncharacterized protein (TIGR02118 family)